MPPTIFFSIFNCFNFHPWNYWETDRANSVRRLYGDCTTSERYLCGYRALLNRYVEGLRIFKMCITFFVKQTLSITNVQWKKWLHRIDYVAVTWSKSPKSRWQHERTTPAKCPCTNDIRILEKKYVSSIHRSSAWRTADRLLQCGDRFKTQYLLPTQTHHLIDANAQGIFPELEGDLPDVESFQHEFQRWEVKCGATEVKSDCIALPTPYQWPTRTCTQMLPNVFTSC